MKQIIKTTKPFRIKLIKDDEPTPDGYTDIMPKGEFLKKAFDTHNNIWVETATPQELAEWHAQKQLEQITQLNEKFERDGQQYYNEIKQRQTVILIGKPNAMAIIAEIKQSIEPMLNQIKAGNYPFALLDYMDGQNNPTIPEVLDLFNEIGQYVSDYYANEYPH